MDILIKIKSLFEKQAVEEAGQAVSGLSEKADSAGKTTEDLGKKISAGGQLAGRAAEQIGTVAGSMGGMSGAAGRAASGVRLLAGSIQAISAAGGGLPGLLASVALLATSGLVNWLVKCAGQIKDLDEQASLAERSLGKMSQVTFAKIQEQTEKLRDAASGAADQYDRILSSRDKMLSAQERADLAKLELEKQVALSALGKNDTYQRQAVETDFAQRAADVSSKAEANRKVYDEAAAEAKVATIEKQIQDQKDAIDRMDRTQLRAQFQVEDDETKYNIAVKSGSLNKQERESQGAEIQGKKDALQKQGDMIADASEVLRDLKLQLVEAKASLSAAKDDRATQKVSSSSADLSRARTATDSASEIRERQKENAKREKELLEQREENAKKRAAAWVDVVKSRGRDDLTKQQQDAQTKSLLRVLQGDGTSPLSKKDSKMVSEALQEPTSVKDRVNAMKDYSKTRKETLASDADISAELSKLQKSDADLAAAKQAIDSYTTKISSTLVGIADRVTKAEQALRNLPNN